MTKPFDQVRGLKPVNAKTFFARGLATEKVDRGACDGQSFGEKLDQGLIGSSFNWRSRQGNLQPSAMLTDDRVAPRAGLRVNRQHQIIARQR